jgi:Glycosyltransferase family 92
MVKVRRQAERLIVTTTLVLAAFAAIGANLVVKSKIHLRLGSERYVAAHLPPRVDSIPGLLWRGDPDVSPLQDHRTDWIHPYAYAALAIPCSGPTCTIRLFIFTQGIALERHGWDIPVAGCRVGRDVYPLRKGVSGVYECVVPRNISMNEPITAIMERNDHVHDMELGGRIVEDVDSLVDHNDFLRLPSDLVMHATLAGMPLDGFRMARSNVSWKGQLDGPSPILAEKHTQEARYEMCVMTQEKAFPEYIDAWLDYHRRVGVDMFYIYDNHAPMDLRAKYGSSRPDDVEVVYWPWVKSQLQAQNHFLVLAKRRCEWVILIDVDEYVMVDERSLGLFSRQPPHAHLKHFLRSMRRRRFGYVQFPEVFMASSGWHHRPKKVPMPEAYIHRRDEYFLSTGKFAVAIDCAKVDSKVHNVTLVEGARAWLPARPHLAINATQPYGHGVIVHFKHRSWEDWVQKGRAGRNSIMVKEWSVAGQREVASPDPGHLNMTAMVEYTAFRTYWRSVMAETVEEPVEPDCPHVVYFESGRRCAGVLVRDESSGLCKQSPGKADMQCEYSQDHLYNMCAEGRRVNYSN